MKKKTETFLYLEFSVVAINKCHNLGVVSDNGTI